MSIKMTVGALFSLVGLLAIGVTDVEAGGRGRGKVPLAYERTNSYLTVRSYGWHKPGGSFQETLGGTSFPDMIGLWYREFPQMDTRSPI